MTSALEGGRGVVKKWTRVLISCVIMYVTRGAGEGVKKFEIVMDVIDGSPLTKQINKTKRREARWFSPPHHPSSPAFHPCSLSVPRTLRSSFPLSLPPSLPQAAPPQSTPPPPPPQPRQSVSPPADLRMAPEVEL